MKRAGVFVALLAVACSALAQDPPEEKDYETTPTYVRRFSAGLTGTAIALMLLRGGTNETLSVSPPLYSKFNTHPKKRYVGGGLTMQLALTDRVAVNANWLYRTAEYESSRTFLSGIDDPKTVRDERVSTGEMEVTKARYFDFPILLRRYNIGRHEYGHRWFVQFGPSLRYVSKIRSNRELTAADQSKTKTSSPVAGHRKSLPGFTAGFGGQLIDPVGVRIMPEVRYTRWFGATFDSPPTRSRRDQVEFMISIGF